MRRFAFPLLVLSLVLAGCGGGGSGTGSNATGLTRLFSVMPSGQHGLSAAVTTTGTPVVGDYDATTQTLTLVSAQGKLGTHTFPGARGVAQITGDFAISFPNEFAPYGLNILNLRTGTSRTVTNQELTAEDGNRIVWHTTAGNVLEDLVTGEGAPLIGTENKYVLALADDWILVRTSINPPEGGNTTYDFAVFKTDGTKIADLRKPDGYPEVDVRAINAHGEAVGIAYNGLTATDGTSFFRDYRLVRWSADGTPTVETSRLLKPGGIADDGTVVGLSLDGFIVRIKDGQSRSLIGTSADSTVQLDRSGALFVTKPDRTLTAYRLR